MQNNQNSSNDIDLIAQKYICISTLHDPESRLNDEIIENEEKIRKLFDKIIICCTTKTGKKTLNSLNSLRKTKFVIITNPGEIIKESYFDVVKIGLEFIKPGQKFFYIDFDRLLHWQSLYFTELQNILRSGLNYEFLHIGRSKKAFQTHPETQTRTETVINKICSIFLNFTLTRDIFSVCWIFSERLGKLLLNQKMITNSGFYSLWPVIMWIETDSKNYVEVEGLEWETPDRYKREISKVGYKEWKKSFQTKNEWFRRIQLLEDSLEEVCLYK